MSTPKIYTTQMQAGLGLLEETKTLLDLWQPGMSSAALNQAALASGRFPNVTARRLHNIVGECFAPRYLVQEGAPALHLKRLAPRLSSADLHQLMFVFTCRANAILGDFVRQVYWERYAGGYSQLSNEDARTFVERALDDGKMGARWSENTVRRVAAYLTGCCADFGLLENQAKSIRALTPLRPASQVTAYLAYDLHCAGMADNALLRHADWQLFGLDRDDVLDEIKRLSRNGLVIAQAAGDVVRISWKYPDMEALCNVLA